MEKPWGWYAEKGIKSRRGVDASRKNVARASSKVLLRGTWYLETRISPWFDLILILSSLNFLSLWLLGMFNLHFVYIWRVGL